MSDKKKDEPTDRKESSTKHASSEKVHSEIDNSTEDGYKPNKK